MKAVRNTVSLSTVQSAKSNRLGNLIRERRMAKNMTQELLASIFGMDNTV